jgi:hypothetical protein
MPRKRSLKDAAADQLVEKKKVVAETPVAPVAIPEAEPSAVQTTPVEPAPESLAEPVPAVQVSQAFDGGKEDRLSLKWAAIFLLIGCVGGYFFGLGQASGPADIFFLIFGLAAGYFFGRF